MSNPVKGLAHLITGTRRFYYEQLGMHAKTIRNKTILELGSGKQVRGKDAYSAKHIFDSSNKFICTDLNPAFGHRVVDVTTMTDREQYDVILCLNVLEHVFETRTALSNLHRALKSGGKAYIAVPVLFPLHDEPIDFWRFTEHALRKLLSDFSQVSIKHKGYRKLPFGYFVEAIK